MSACSHKRKLSLLLSFACLLCMFCFLFWFLQRQLRFWSNFFFFFFSLSLSLSLSLLPQKPNSFPFFSVSASIFFSSQLSLSNFSLSLGGLAYWVTARCLWLPKLSAFSEDLAIPELLELGLELEFELELGFFSCRNLISRFIFFFLGWKMFFTLCENFESCYWFVTKLWAFKLLNLWLWALSS